MLMGEWQCWYDSARLRQGVGQVRSSGVEGDVGAMPSCFSIVLVYYYGIETRVFTGLWVHSRFKDTNSFNASIVYSFIPLIRV